MAGDITAISIELSVQEDYISTCYW